VTTGAYGVFVCDVAVAVGDPAIVSALRAIRVKSAELPASAAAPEKNFRRVIINVSVFLFL
jgi:hypothetical protein